VYQLDFNTTTFITAGVALLATPLVSLLTPPSGGPSLERVWASRTGSDEERSSGRQLHLIPVSRRGWLGLGLLAGGLAVFLIGVIMGSQDAGSSGTVAVVGMILYFTGGLLRSYSD